MRIGDWSSDVCSSDLVAMLLLKKFDSTSDFGFIHRWATPIRSFGGISCPACRAICMLSKDKVALSHQAEKSSKFYDLVGGHVVHPQETTRSDASRDGTESCITISL